MPKLTSTSTNTTPSSSVAGRMGVATANIPVAISARHVHLTQRTVERLFGTGHQLTQRFALGQPGQYAAEETVTFSIVGVVLGDETGLGTLIKQVTPNEAHLISGASKHVPIELSATVTLVPGDVEFKLRIPSNSNVTPPGYYMIFLISDAGAPSMARIVRIEKS